MNKNHKKLNLTDDEIADLLEMRDHFWKEDTATRQIQLQKWRRLKFFWNNISNVWWDSVAHDWRVGGFEDIGGTDQEYYDQRINVFKAYLESIFAALSVLVPPIKAFPDDAENSLDLETAKAADKIAAIIYRHNEAPMLWLHNLYIWGTEGLVCGYNYSKYDKEYGTYKVDEYQEIPEVHEVSSCPLCNFQLSNELVDPNATKENPEVVAQEEIAPGIPGIQEGIEQDPELMEEMGMLPMGQEICPNCNQPMIPVTEQIHSVSELLLGTTEEPKGRICLESYGGLNVKIPLYARKQEECLYLFYCYETHYANAIKLVPELHDKIQGQISGNQSGSYDNYEQWARLNTEYKGEYPVNCVTIKSAWFKHAAYNILTEDRAKHWKKKYPDGISGVFVNDLFGYACEQKLDDHWTLEYNPMADYLSDDPLGSLLTATQEITNDLISLTKQTAEHGVGLTIVDPAFIDLNAYAQTEVTPGAMIPSKTISGNKKLTDGIVELKTATLSGEIMPFGEQIQQLGQLASGAIPSLFGGQIEGSGTASEYSMSSNSAKSRLGLHWKRKCNWWKNYIGKAVKMYVSIIECDERDVLKGTDGNFVNIVIRKAELSGKIGRFELEANENLPMSWAQRKDVIQQLILSPNPSIVQWLMQPENLPVLRESIGLDNFYVPGADDVDKQWAEIQQLINSEPIETGDELMPLTPSVEVDVIMDTHPIQFEICRKWCVSEVGQYFKYNHPGQYQNVLLHGKQHLDAINAGQPANPEEEGAPNQEKPKEANNKDAPITGDVNVSN